MKTNRYTRTPEQRLWEKVASRADPDKCWLWTGGVNGKGYGTIRIARKTFLAHRMAYEFVIGPIPDGMKVCHRCDNPPCCNPAHFFLGTVQDNVDDMFRKKRGRKARGERVSLAKLTESQVVEIRASDGPHHKIAKQYGVNRTTISNIKRGKTWAHIPPRKQLSLL